MDAYTNFPNCCCRCLRPNPQGSWRVKNSQRQNLGTGTVRVQEVSVQVPMCGPCRRNLMLRNAVVLGGALLAAGLILAWWYWDTRKLEYLPIGAGIAFIVFIVAVLVLAFLFGPKQVAYLAPDGSDIKFANLDYQKMYTGEKRPGRQGEADWREHNWR